MWRYKRLKYALCIKSKKYEDVHSTMNFIFGVHPSRSFALEESPSSRSLRKTEVHAIMIIVLLLQKMPQAHNAIYPLAETMDHI